MSFSGKRGRLCQNLLTFFRLKTYLGVKFEEKSYKILGGDFRIMTKICLGVYFKTVAHAGVHLHIWALPPKLKAAADYITEAILWTQYQTDLLFMCVWDGVGIAALRKVWSEFLHDWIIMITLSVHHWEIIVSVLYWIRSDLSISPAVFWIDGEGIIHVQEMMSWFAIVSTNWCRHMLNGQSNRK